MATRSKIEWTETTWNPVRGCSKVSAGCQNCYAMRQAHRFSGPGKPYEGLTKIVPGKGPQWTGTVRCVPETLDQPLRWRAPRRVFVNSMSDLFHEAVPVGFIAHVFAVMAEARRHTFQVLTKRPERMRELLGSEHFWSIVHMHGMERWWTLETLAMLEVGACHPLPNVWLGTSVENQAAAEERIPHLIRTPAAIRFLSCEPLLGPLDLGPSLALADSAFDSFVRDLLETVADALELPGPDGLHWVIAGGESGPGAGPCVVDWIRSLVRQCADAVVPVFVKQLGARPHDRNDRFTFGSDPEPDRWPDGIEPPDAYHPMYQGELCRVVLTDRKGGDPAEWPEDLRVREMPIPSRVRA